jgi:hypothetical protein
MKQLRKIINESVNDVFRAIANKTKNAHPGFSNAMRYGNLADAHGHYSKADPDTKASLNQAIAAHSHYHDVHELMRQAVAPKPKPGIPLRKKFGREEFIHHASSWIRNFHLANDAYQENTRKYHIGIAGEHAKQIVDGLGVAPNDNRWSKIFVSLSGISRDPLIHRPRLGELYDTHFGKNESVEEEGELLMEMTRYADYPLTRAVISHFAGKPLEGLHEIYPKHRKFWAASERDLKALGHNEKSAIRAAEDQPFHHSLLSQEMDDTSDENMRKIHVEACKRARMPLTTDELITTHFEKHGAPF